MVSPQELKLIQTRTYEGNRNKGIIAKQHKIDIPKVPTMGHKQHSHFKLTFSQSREAFIEGHGQATTKKSNLKGKAGLLQSEFSLKNQQDRVQSSQLYKHNMR